MLATMPELSEVSRCHTTVTEPSGCTMGCAPSLFVVGSDTSTTGFQVLPPSSEELMTIGERVPDPGRKCSRTHVASLRPTCGLDGLVSTEIEGLSWNKLRSRSSAIK